VSRAPDHPDTIDGTRAAARGRTDEDDHSMKHCTHWINGAPAAGRWPDPGQRGVNLGFPTNA
jgi:hypothetical protein